MEIGINLLTDSDAVFFSYSNAAQPYPLTMPVSGNPLTTISNVTFNGLSFTEESKQRTLNTYLSSSRGLGLLLTSDLYSTWSKCLLFCLSGLRTKPLTLYTPFNLHSWRSKINSNICFSKISIAGVDVIDDNMFNAFADANDSHNHKLSHKLVHNLIDDLSFELSK
jgi:hypothetical protein